MEEEPSVSDEVMAVPVMVSLSYHDAGRWLDAQEQVDQVPAPTEVVAWVSAVQYLAAGSRATTTMAR